MVSKIPLHFRAFLLLDLCGALGAFLGLLVLNQLHFFIALILLSTCGVIFAIFAGFILQIFTYRQKKISRWIFLTLASLLTLITAVFSWYSVRITPEELFAQEFRIGPPQPGWIQQSEVIPSGLGYYVLFAIRAPEEEVQKIIKNLELTKVTMLDDANKIPEIWEIGWRNFFNMSRHDLYHQLDSQLEQPEWWNIPFSRQYEFYRKVDTGEKGSLYNLLWLKDHNTAYYERICY